MFLNSENVEEVRNSLHDDLEKLMDKYMLSTALVLTSANTNKSTISVNAFHGSSLECLGMVENFKHAVLSGVYNEEEEDI